MSTDKYRLYCASAMRPKKYMLMQLQFPLTGNWIMPDTRAAAMDRARAEISTKPDLGQINGDGNDVSTSEIERSVDVEMTYFFNYDD